MNRSTTIRALLVVAALTAAGSVQAVGAATAATLSDEALMRDTRTLVDFGWRRDGTASSRAASDFVRTEFERAGLRTTVESWPLDVYYPKKWGVALTSSTASGAPQAPWKAESYPVWYSSPKSVEAEVVYVGAGTPADLAGKDLKGKIVLVDAVYALNLIPTDEVLGTYKAAIKAGAVGYLRTASAPGNAPRLLSANQTRTDKATLGEIPAMLVGASDFKRLRDAAVSGTTRIRLELENENPPKGGWRRVEGGSLGPGTHLLRGAVDDVVGILPGQTQEVIIVGAHYDSTFSGAVDNATGVATMLGLMRHYAALPLAQREKTMVFLGAAGHDPAGFDLVNFVEEHKDDFLPHTVVFNWLDHLAATGANYLPEADETVATGIDELRGVIGSANPAVFASVTAGMTTNGVLSGPFLGPLSSVRKLPSYVPSFNVTLNPPWYHTSLDTLERVDAEQLGRAANAHVTVLDEFMRADGAAVRLAQATPQPIPAEPWTLPTTPPCGAGTGNGPRVGGPADAAGRWACDNGTSSGSDAIDGTNASDAVQCGFGHDRVSGGAGSDLLVCDRALEAGQEKDGMDPNGIAVGDVDGKDDVLTGGTGGDRLYGGFGADLLFGGFGADSLRGGPGNDRLYGGFGADLLSGSAGSDTIEGGGGNDHLRGNAANDRLSGGPGKDRLRGGPGNDRLRGGAGADRLRGIVGKDRLDGGSGRDVLNARDGGRDAIRCGAGRDVVFADAGDRVARDCEVVRRRAPVLGVRTSGRPGPGQTARRAPVRGVPNAPAPTRREREDDGP